MIKRGFSLVGLIVIALCPIVVTADAEPVVSLEFTYPVGESPSIFQEGWMFGAKCIVNPGQADEKDISDSVNWSGTGLFKPAKGKITYTYFPKPGKNTIKITATVEGKAYTKEINTNVVNMLRTKYATVSSIAECPACAHGCPACPHPVKGPITAGSPTVLLGGQPAARKGDPGIHSACCGANSYEIVEGDPNVLIDGRPAARVGDKTKHCGGAGKIISNSYNYSPRINPKEMLEWIVSEGDMPQGVEFTRWWGGMGGGPDRPSYMVEFKGPGLEGKSYYGYVQLIQEKSVKKARDQYKKLVKRLGDRLISKDLKLGEYSVQYGSGNLDKDAYYSVQQVDITWNEWTLKIAISSYGQAGAYTDHEAGEILKGLGKKTLDRLRVAIEGLG